VVDDTPGENIMTGPAWSKEETDSVEVTHRPPAGIVDHLSLYTVKTLRFCFDIVSGYVVKSKVGAMKERDWIRRIMFLETVAGVPGMVAGMSRHLRSLRAMQRDYGWIHSLLAEAENERMHLLIALKLRNPGIGFRLLVIAGQAGFFAYYTIAYIISPRYCHRLVAYLEEEAVYTYTKLIEQIDGGSLPLFKHMKAPSFAVKYYNLDKDAMLREVFNCMRMDESAHRDANHHFGDLKPDEPNVMTDHLVKHHFGSFHILQGVDACAWKFTENALRKEFHALDKNKNGTLSLEELKEAPAIKDSVDLEQFEEMWREVGGTGNKELSEKEFLELMRKISNFDSENFR